MVKYDSIIFYPNQESVPKLFLVINVNMSIGVNIGYSAQCPSLLFLQAPVQKGGSRIFKF